MRTTLLTILSLLPLSAQSPNAAAPPPDKVYMEASRKVAQPGPEHERLAALAGSWQTVQKFWFGPTSTPVESGGKAEIRKILWWALHPRGEPWHQCWPAFPRTPHLRFR